MTVTRSQKAQHSTSVLRTFAFDLQVPFNFMVEMESDLLLQTAIERLLAKVGSDETLTRTLIDFILQKVDTEKNWVWFWKKVTFYDSGNFTVYAYDCFDYNLTSGSVRINFR